MVKQGAQNYFRWKRHRLRFCIFIGLLALMLLWMNVTQGIAETLCVPDQFKTIQSAVDAASEGDVILVADGVWEEDDAILDFMGKAIEIQSENGPDTCRLHTRVWFHRGEDRRAVLSGFTVENTEGVPEPPYIPGGAVYEPPLIFKGVSDYPEPPYMPGGAVSCESASPIIRECIIKNNLATDIGNAYGGGLYLEDSDALIRETVIQNNASIGTQQGGVGVGGGVYVSGGNPEMINCVLWGNRSSGSSLHGVSAGGIGHEIACDSGTLTIINSTLMVFPESEDERSALYLNVNAQLFMVNVIARVKDGLVPLFENYGALDIRYTNVQDGWDGEGNIDEDPLFISTDTSDFRLAEGSPCIDSGTFADAPDFDIEGSTRPLGNGLDMGAYEYIPSSGPESNPGSESDSGGGGCFIRGATQNFIFF